MPPRFHHLLLALSILAFAAVALASFLIWQIVHVRQDILTARARCTCCSPAPETS